MSRAYNATPRPAGFEEHRARRGHRRTAIEATFAECYGRLAKLLIYMANKANGMYEYVGVDCDWVRSGRAGSFLTTVASGNAYGGITALLEDEDLMIAGAFAIKRVNTGEGARR